MHKLKNNNMICLIDQKDNMIKIQIKGQVLIEISMKEL